MTGFWGQQRRSMRGHRRAARRWSDHWLTHVLTIVALVAVWLALWGEVTTGLVVGGILLAVLVLVLFPLPPLQFRLGFHPWSMVVLISRSGYCTITTRYDRAAVNDSDLWARSLLAGFDEVLALGGDGRAVPASFSADPPEPAKISPNGSALQ